jgi:hypothetical protein
MVTPQQVTFRRATISDAERLGQAVIEGVEGYRSFAPRGWTPPSLADEVEHLRGLLGDAQVWCLPAVADGRLAGQITVLPAARAARPVHDPALAHVRNLFACEDRWGTGLAGALDAAGVEAARELPSRISCSSSTATHCASRRRLAVE